MPRTHLPGFQLTIDASSTECLGESPSEPGHGLAKVAFDGRWLQVDASICKILEYSCDELLAMTFQDITHPDDLAGDLSLLRQVLDNRIASYTLEKRYIKRSGGIMWGLLTVSLLRNQDGKPECFLSRVVDITAARTADDRAR